jgi:hypothetical protein
MDGYILQLVPDEDTASVAFWSENESMTEDINQANLFVDISSARLQAGQLQASYTSHTVHTLAASKGVTLKTHVEPSFTNQSASTL